MQEMTELALMRIGRLLVYVQRVRDVLLALVAQNLDVGMPVERRNHQRRQEYRQQQRRIDMSPLLHFHFSRVQR